MKSSFSYLASWLRHDVCTSACDGSNRCDSSLRDAAYRDRLKLPPRSMTSQTSEFRRMGHYTAGVYICLRYRFSYKAKNNVLTLDHFFFNCKVEKLCDSPRAYLLPMVSYIPRSGASCASNPYGMCQLLTFIECNIIEDSTGIAILIFRARKVAQTE